MSRRPVVDAAAERAVLADPRFQAALAHRRAPTGWREAGACTQVDPEKFFPHPAEDPREALALCRRCPVSGPCLATALHIGDAEGVWGQTTAGERRTMRVVWSRMPVEGPS